MEKAGTLSYDGLQAQAKQAISGFAGRRQLRVRPGPEGYRAGASDKRKEGVVDMGGTMPDGRTLMQVYLDALKAGDQVQVDILTKRPKVTNRFENQRIGENAESVESSVTVFS